MTHALILPVLLPILAAVLCLALHRGRLSLQRAISVGAAVLLLLLAAHLVWLARTGDVFAYRLGDWPSPFGIVLVLDRLSAFMVALTAVLALPALIYATAGFDARGPHFHALFQLQIAGLNGAFLTGDVFNLFVFFEVLLLASYALLLHGGGGVRSRAGVAYVVLNLAGSALFLVALALLYAALGTLNLADMAQVLQQLPADTVALARSAGAILLVVFALKAALLPLGFWLPHAYAAAGAPVAALFAIMTKLGVYAVLRVTAIGFAAGPGTADLLQPWLAPLAVATIALGTLGVLAAHRLAPLVANVVLISTATVLAVVANGEVGSGAAALYYLSQSVLVTGALFLLVGLIGEGRGDLHDRIARGPRLRGVRWIGWAFLVLAIAASGVPPLSGFIGKLMMLASVPLTLGGVAVWIAILLSSFVVALALARTASTLFWEARPEPFAAGVPFRFDARHVALILILGAGLLFVPAAAQISAYADATAQQLYSREAYMSAVLGPQRDIVRELRP